MRRFNFCVFASLFLSAALLASSLASAARPAFLPFEQASAFDVECGSSCGGQSDSRAGFDIATADFTNPSGGAASAFALVQTNANGGLYLKAFATATGADGSTFFNDNRGKASAMWQDEVHYTGSPLELLFGFKFDVSGSKSGDALVSAGGIACINGSCPDSTQTLNGPGQINFTPPFLLPRSVPVQLTVNLSVTATGHASGGPNSSSADFSHSMTLVSITPRDAQGNIVSDITLVSDSGFDYNPFLVTNQTPEPSTLVLGGKALAALGLLSRAKPRN